MAKNTSAKQPPAKAEPPADPIPMANDPSASRNQVPPGQTAEQTQAVYQEAVLDENVQPVANDPAASRNQIPPGQTAEQSRGDVNDTHVVDMPAPNVVHIAEQAAAKPVYRDPTDSEIEAFIERRYPGKMEAILGNKDAAQRELERLHGPNFITAFQGDNPDPRYFSTVTWQMLGGNANKEGWRQRVTVPDEIKNLQKK